MLRGGTQTAGSREFHNLAESMLNREAGNATCWGNLGYWADEQTYPEAAAALAEQLGIAASLCGDSRLFDVGFGCGDQLLVWRQRFGVESIAGINLSRSQTALAQRRSRDAGHVDIADAIAEGNAMHFDDHMPASIAADTIVSLDAAYHFPSRQRFVAAAARLLPEGGILALTDIVRGDGEPGLGDNLALRTMAKASRIPWKNLVTANEYQRQLRECGFEILTFRDITAQVFQPFGAWLAGYRLQHAQPEDRWHKYRVTAAVLNWAQRRDLLRYVVCAGRKVATS